MHLEAEVVERDYLPVPFCEISKLEHGLSPFASGAQNDNLAVPTPQR
jgi:hypothetical protein